MRLLVIILSLLPLALFAQKQEDTFNILKGNWEGAFIKNNAHQPINIQFYKKGESYYSLQIIEEWHPQFGEFEIPVSIDSTGKISTNTGHGKAILELDKNYLEMTGYLEGTNPTIYLHLKKVPPLPKPSYSVEEVAFSSGEVMLSGHMHLPKHSNSNSAIILVGGRGCYAGSTKYDLYAKILRQYGMTVLVFNKRGTGKSTGNCEDATIEDLASDVRACKAYLESHSRNFDNIGVLGSSAGGWVMVKAEEKVDFDFMISVVGPSTSVKDQQLKSMDYGLDFYKLSEEARTALKEYTNMMFEAEANETNFDRFEELLQKAEQQGWKELLDDTDIPSSSKAIDSLWVRRHAFDPGSELGNFSNPFLAIYGEIDWIVPYKENIARLNKLFSDDRSELLTTIIAHDSEHGTEVKDQYITLGNGKSYWHFFRISPQVLIEIIEFLRRNNFID